MSTLHTEIEKHIKKLVRPLKEEDELVGVLKVKLTKKEFKLLKAWVENIEMSTLLDTLNLNEERYAELSTKLIKKLNQEKTKQAMCI